MSLVSEVAGLAWAGDLEELLVSCPLQVSNLIKQKSRGQLGRLWRGQKIGVRG